MATTIRLMPKAKKAHAKKWSEIFEKRKQGIYHNEDTLEEIGVCVQNLQKDDCVLTLLHSQGVFSVYNQREFLPQLLEWKEKKCRVQSCNVREVEIEGKSMFLFVVQPPKDKMEQTNFCPLSLACGLMVSGFGYLTPNPKLVELVIKNLA